VNCSPQRRNASPILWPSDLKSHGNAARRAAREMHMWGQPPSTVRPGQKPGGCRRVRLLAAYKDFLTLWKDADPDIPILKEAKAEYANLQ
jgi:hypothetical protein